MGIEALSVLFLTVACESKIISRQNVFENSIIMPGYLPWVSRLQEPTSGYHEAWVHGGQLQLCPRVLALEGQRSTMSLPSACGTWQSGVIMGIQHMVEKWEGQKGMY